MFKNLFNRCPIDHSEVIEFIPSSEAVSKFVEPPQVSKNSIPLWYKNIENFNQNSPVYDGTEVRKSLKMCLPFLDCLTSGYVQKTWSDIVFDSRENNAEYKWILPPQPLEHRSTPVSLPIPTEFCDMEFHWKMPWMIRVPKGYSVLITHPFNRVDLPFFTLSGIIDADEFFHVRFGNLPFYIKKNFQGIIETGTPMFQIIPFKRNIWKSEVLPYEDDTILKREYTFGNKMFGEYKNRFWRKKRYE